MNKTQIVASLNKIANELDNSGLFREANTVTKVMEKLAAFESVDFSGLEAKFKEEDAAPLYVKIKKLMKDKNLLALESGYSAKFVLGRAVAYFNSSDKEAFKADLLESTRDNVNKRINERIYKIIDELEYFQLKDNLSDQEMIEGIEIFYDSHVRLVNDSE
jgi:hypothetical protein